MVRVCELVLLVGVFACGRVGFDVTSSHGDASTGDGNASDTRLRVAEVAIGNDFTCARSNRGEVTCWGNNSWGKLGIPSSDPSPRGDAPGELTTLVPIDLGLGTGVTAESLTRGLDSTCALLSDHTAKCWGNNDGAQLLAGAMSNVGDAPGEMGDALGAVAIAGGGPFDQIVSGHYHTCVLRSSKVWCGGLNDLAQNGYGNFTASRSRAQLAALPPVNLGTNFVPVELTAGFNATCARDAQGRVKCWGYAGSGDTGLGETSTRGDQASDMGDALPFLQFAPGVAATQISGGNGFACIVSAQTVRCWGHNLAGVIGNGTTQNAGDQPGEVVTLGALPLGAPVARVSAGGAFACALLTTGEVACWGQNNHGQLGLGDNNDRGDTPGEIDGSLRVRLPEPAVGVFLGERHACATLASGAVACWGYNDSGQLGSGDANDRGDSARPDPFVIQATDLWTP